ncbi:hypothetical protein GECvBN3_gp029 [Salmonella phage GEC_vB_N3]|uniref:Uncharacterized protein n=2 Tax=Epseptimavirus TaxID=2732017 RepID=A0A7S9SSL8_9CAUD|nr:hypothetical protein GECvBN3_gp029 [Salmonella phage GEC_vB_N3]QPI15471.1 hypothetical protein GECvBN7_gp028 [Salmonella phage GEC_vB_N7]
MSGNRVYHLECKLCVQKFYLLFKYKIPPIS